MMGIEPFIRYEPHKIVPYPLNRSTLGEPGVGKTPLTRILDMMMSHHFVPHGLGFLDFFRGVQFSKMLPAIFDDVAAFQPFRLWHCASSSHYQAEEA